MGIRNRGRYFAPIAILVVIAATFLIVRGELGSKRHSSRSATAARETVVHHRPKPQASSFYLVKSGDSLSEISVKTGVSVATLESLNPNVDPNALQTGQRLKLR